MKPKPLFFSLCLACVLAGCGGGSSAAKSSVAASSAPAIISASSLINTSSQIASSSSQFSSQAFSASSLAPTSTLIPYGSNPMQLGELRMPQDMGAEAVPVVVIIHGGCWVSSVADYKFMDTFAQAITKLGYATWNIEYRAQGTGGDWPVMFKDVSGALDHLAILAGTYSLDLDKIAVIGHSAGGHLALWLASRPRLPHTSELYTQTPLSVRGVISLAGIANVTANNGCASLINPLIGVALTPSSAELANRLQETSPLQMLPSHGKTILISGGADNVVPPAMGAEYSAIAAGLGDDSAHYILSGLGHFDLIEPATTDWALYQQSLEEIFKD